MTGWGIGGALMYLASSRVIMILRALSGRLRMDR
jgi:hypothetical protein